MERTGEERVTMTKKQKDETTLLILGLRFQGGDEGTRGQGGGRGGGGTWRRGVVWMKREGCERKRDRDAPE